MTDSHTELELFSNEGEQALMAMLEALIFMGKDPMTPDQMVQAINAIGEEEVSASDIKRALKSLKIKWDGLREGGGFGIILNRIAGGYLFSTAPEHASLVKKVYSLKPLELTKAQIEVLSIVAYRQPITRIDVDEIRGVDSSFALKRLMQLNLLKILGKSEGLGRPLLYGTSRYFLEFFSLNSLNDLPTLKQFDALSSEEQEDGDSLPEGVSLKDLFLQNKPGSLLSEEVQRQSEDALKGLDEALSRIEKIKKAD
jgi:segregation and condensation protein B